MFDLSCFMFYVLCCCLLFCRKRVLMTHLPAVSWLSTPPSPPMFDLSCFMFHVLRCCLLFCRKRVLMTHLPAVCRATASSSWWRSPSFAETHSQPPPPLATNVSTIRVSIASSLLCPRPALVDPIINSRMDVDVNINISRRLLGTQKTRRTTPLARCPPPLPSPSRS